MKILTMIQHNDAQSGIHVQRCKRQIFLPMIDIVLFLVTVIVFKCFVSIVPGHLETQDILRVAFK